MFEVDEMHGSSQIGVTKSAKSAKLSHIASMPEITLSAKMINCHFTSLSEA